MESFYAHLRGLETRQVNTWYAEQTLPGTQWEQERDRRLLSADLILLLVSADFINSAHYEKLVSLAMERDKKGEARVIPIILRAAYWQDTPFGKLQPLPDGGKPIKDWKTLDHAFLNVIHGIKRIIDEEKRRLPGSPENSDLVLPAPEKPAPLDTRAIIQLKQLIQTFKSLRGQIADAVRLRGPQGFSVESCERQYNKLYGDTMVLLATYLPHLLLDEEEGFVEAVYREAMAQLRQRSNFSVWLARQAIAPLARFEKLAAQIDACVATLESYKQKYFL